MQKRITPKGTPIEPVEFDNDVNLTFTGAMNPEADTMEADIIDEPEYACVVCGSEIFYGGRGPKPKYCEAHKEPAKRTPAKKTVSSKRVGKRGATEAEWSHFGSVMLIAISWLIARFAAGGQGIMLRPPPGMPLEQLDEASDLMSLTQDEASVLAKFMAVRITPSNFNKKFGQAVVKSLEYEDIGWVLFDYSKRVGPALAARVYKPKPKAPKAQKGINNGTTQPPTPDGRGILSNRDAARYLRQSPTNS